MRKRFEREITALKRMSHPNIITCDGENLLGDERFYVMPPLCKTVAEGILPPGGFAMIGERLPGSVQCSHGRSSTHTILDSSIAI